MLGVSRYRGGEEGAGEEEDGEEEELHRVGEGSVGMR